MELAGIRGQSWVAAPAAETGTKQADWWLNITSLKIFLSCGSPLWSATWQA